MRRSFGWVGLGVAAFFAIAACVGSDPLPGGITPENDAAVTTPDASTTQDGGSNTDADGVDADLPPKAEGKFRWGSAYATGTEAVTVGFAGDAVVFASGIADAVSFDGRAVAAAAGGGPASDFAVMKLDANGKANGAGTWLVEFRGSQFDAVTGLASDAAGDVYVGGTSYSDSITANGGDSILRPANATAFGFVYKLSIADGHVMWARRFEAATDALVEAIAFRDGHLVVGGSFTGATLGYRRSDGAPGTVAGFGARTGWAAKLKPDSGEALWVNALGSDANTIVRTVTVLAGGDVVAGGYFGGATLDDKAGSNKTVARAGTSFNGYAARLGATEGKIAWAKGYGDVASGAAIVAVTSASAGGPGLALAGWYEGAATLGASSPPPVAGGEELGNGYVLSLDPSNGNTQWQKILTGAKGEELLAVAVDRWGYVTSSGVYRSADAALDGVTLVAPALDVTSHGVVAKWSPQGAMLWSKLLVPEPEVNVTPTTASPRTIAVHGSGDLAFAGGFKGRLDIGGGTKTTATRLNGFVVRVGP